MALGAQVQASSPSCKHTDPKAVVSGNFLRLNLAGPSKTGTWWQINLGPGHRLICNYYTLRHDGSSEFPLCWALQVLPLTQQSYWSILEQAGVRLH